MESPFAPFPRRTLRRGTTRQILISAVILTLLLWTARFLFYGAVGGPTETRRTARLSGRFNKTALPPCTWPATELVGRIHARKENVSYSDVERSFGFLSSGGGHFRPRDCQARQRTAIIIPFRERHHHLPLLLNNLIPYLQKQHRDVTFYVLEQVSGSVFNKGVMMNAGFVEAARSMAYDCYIFHDVDLFPENDRISYECRKDQVVHLAAAIRKYYYNPLKRYAGGALAFTERQFREVNGFSNLYNGWGSEDDDMRFRLDHLSAPVFEVPVQIGRYYTFNHTVDRGNPVNKYRSVLLWEAGKRAEIDGVSSLKYTVRSVHKHTLFTWIKVAFDPLNYRSLFESVVSGTLRLP